MISGSSFSSSSLVWMERVANEWMIHIFLFFNSIFIFNNTTVRPSPTFHCYCHSAAVLMSLFCPEMGGKFILMAKLIFIAQWIFILVVLFYCRMDLSRACGCDHEFLMTLKIFLSCDIFGNEFWESHQCSFRKAQKWPAVDKSTF